MTAKYKAAAVAILDGLGKLAEKLQELHDAMAFHRTALPRIPKLTTEMNRARRKLGETLEELMAGALEGKSFYLEAEKSLHDVLESQCDNAPEVELGDS